MDIFNSMIRNLKELKDGSDIVTKDIQDFITDLTLYIPQSGDYLINVKELIKKCKNIWNHIIELNT